MAYRLPPPSPGSPSEYSMFLAAEASFSAAASDFGESPVSPSFSSVPDRSPSPGSVFSRPAPSYLSSCSTMGGLMVMPPPPVFAGGPGDVAASTALGPDGEGDPRVPGSDRLLWCELDWVYGCGQRFSVEHVDEWVWHIMVGHLGGHVPEQSMCWFCNADNWAVPAGAPELLRRETFATRLRHIAHHIAHGRRRHDHIRPDYYMLHHLHRLGVLNDRQFRRQMAYDELRHLQLGPTSAHRPRPPSPEVPLVTKAGPVAENRARKRHGIKPAARIHRPH